MWRCNRTLLPWFYAMDEAIRSEGINCSPSAEGLTFSGGITSSTSAAEPCASTLSNAVLPYPSSPSPPAPTSPAPPASASAGSASVSTLPTIPSTRRATEQPQNRKEREGSQFDK